MSCVPYSGVLRLRAGGQTIRRKLAEGWRGPVLLTWLEQLLQDRDERRQREREKERDAEQPQRP